MQLLTVIESPLFARYWPDYWSDDEHDEFVAFIAMNPEAGDVVPGSGGCRKVRWSAGGKGATDNIPAHVLQQLAKELGHADE